MMEIRNGGQMRRLVLLLLSIVVCGASAKVSGFSNKSIHTEVSSSLSRELISIADNPMHVQDRFFFTHPFKIFWWQCPKINRENDFLLITNHAETRGVRKLAIGEVVKESRVGRHNLRCANHDDLKSGALADVLYDDVNRCLCIRSQRLHTDIFYDDPRSFANLQFGSHRIPLEVGDEHLHNSGYRNDPREIYFPVRHSLLFQGLSWGCLLLAFGLSQLSVFSFVQGRPLYVCGACMIGIFFLVHFWFSLVVLGDPFSTLHIMFLPE